MRVLLAVLLVSSALAYDAVIFSNDQKITREFPTVENILSTASANAPVVFLVNPDFTLGQFSARANAYSGEKVSGLPASVKGSKYSTARYLSSGIHTPSAVEVTSANDFKTGSAVYIIAGEDWTALDKLAQEVIPKLGEKYTGVIVASEAVSKDQARVKRVATDEMTGDGNGNGDTGKSIVSNVAMPLVIPPYNNSDIKPDVGSKYGNCLFYAEGVNIVVKNGAGQFAVIPIRPNDTQWSFNENDVSCVNSTVGHYIFTVRFKTIKDVIGTKDQEQAIKLPSGSDVVFTLDIMGDNLGYWQLSNATIGAITIQPNQGSNFLGKAVSTTDGTPTKQVDYMGMNSVQGWAFGCSDSQAVFFPSSVSGDNVLIGISLYNTEIQPYGVFDQEHNRVYFTLNVDDCTGTFSPGSWMAIVSSLVLLMGFFFGYLMLNSVKTMDRFDDPKQRQIVINVRE